MDRNARFGAHFESREQVTGDTWCPDVYTANHMMSSGSVLTPIGDSRMFTAYRTSINTPTIGSFPSQRSPSSENTSKAVKHHESFIDTMTRRDGFWAEVIFLQPGSSFSIPS